MREALIKSYGNWQLVGHHLQVPVLRVFSALDPKKKEVFAFGVYGHLARRVSNAIAGHSETEFAACTSRIFIIISFLGGINLLTSRVSILQGPYERSVDLYARVLTRNKMLEFIKFSASRGLWGGEVRILRTGVCTYE